MKEKTKRLGIQERVIFYGASSEMEKMYQAMDVFLMPSLHEGLPVTGVEAPASGFSFWFFSESIPLPRKWILRVIRNFFL